MNTEKGISKHVLDYIDKTAMMLPADCIEEFTNHLGTITETVHYDAWDDALMFYCNQIRADRIGIKGRWQN